MIDPSIRKRNCVFMIEYYTQRSGKQSAFWRRELKRIQRKETGT